MDIGIVVLIITILGMAGYAYYIFGPKPPPTPAQQAYIDAFVHQQRIESDQKNINDQINSDAAAARNAATAAQLPRQKIGDNLGDSDAPGQLIRGWYDIQKQGVSNDYCAYFNKVWYCALAGSKGFTTASEISTVAERAPNKK